MKKFMLLFDSAEGSSFLINLLSQHKDICVPLFEHLDEYHYNKKYDKEYYKRNIHDNINDILKFLFLDVLFDLKHLKNKKLTPNERIIKIKIINTTVPVDISIMYVCIL